MPSRSSGWVMCWLLCLATWMHPSQAWATEFSFKLQEHFGVTHPDQVLTFDLTQAVDPTKHVLIETSASGQREVAYQVLDQGRMLALRSNLVAGESKTFTLKPGSPRAADPLAVKLTEAPNHWELTNGVTGVRIPKAVNAAATKQIPAPLQGVMMRDGKWYGTGPNWLEYQAYHDFNKKCVATGMKVTVIEPGPMRAIVRVEYRFRHPNLTYGSTIIKPAGEGYHTSTIRLDAGQPSILIEEDTDFESRWSIDLFDAIQPTHARFRGHQSTDKRWGYGPDGEALKPAHARGPMEAQVDVTFDQMREPNYNASEKTWPMLWSWNPWSVNSGWTWQAFNQQAGDNANIVGFFAGPASRAITPNFCGVSIVSGPGKDGGQPRFGISSLCFRRDPGGRVFPRSRWSWGLFVGTKGHDLKPQTDVQGIGLQWNLHAGINLDKIHRYTLDFPDPPQGWGAMYMPKAAVQSVIERVRTDRDYRNWAYNVEPSGGRQLIDLWTDDTGKQARKLTDDALKLARDMLDAHVNQYGIFQIGVHYWHGGLAMSRWAVVLDQLLASDKTTPEDRVKLKAVAVFFASVLFDNDFVPMDNYEGINLGTPNMPVQQQGYRSLYALLLARHPMMKEHTSKVTEAARSMLARTVNEHGAHMGSLHYVGAAMGPLLATFQQLQSAGIYDGFAHEPRLEKFAEFYLQAMTPPEVRFGGVRMMPAIGDGSTEATEAYGMLGTSFTASKPDLSKRLMGAWRAMGKFHQGFHGSTLVKIDDTLPGVSPDLTDAAFPGYFTVLRSGWGTPQENAVWCVNGNFYIDHSHSDLGSLVIYLLGAPLSIDWGSIYSPRAAGGVMHSTVIQESAFGQPWDQDIKALDLGLGFSSQYGNHGIGEATLLDVKPDGRRMIVTVREGLRPLAERNAWIRTVSLVNAEAQQPLLFITDSFQGPEANKPKIWTMNFLAEGDVETPAGMQSPPLRKFPYAPAPKNPQSEMPSAGPVFSVAAGVNRLSFTGQPWKGHPTGGIDFNVYLIPTEPQEAHIGNWACVPGAATSQFQAAQGRAAEERQHILRVRGISGFNTLILPWGKGGMPPEVRVTRQGEHVIFESPTQVVRFNADGTWQRQARQP